MIGTTATAGSLGAEFAASLPRYDPLAPESGQRSRRLVLAVSLLVHAGILLAFWDTLLGAVQEQEETVIVRVIQEEEPVPEQPQLKRKVLAQRRINASVQRYKSIAQPEVVEVTPVQKLAQARKVQVKPIELTTAPKAVKQRSVQTEKVSVFADKPTQRQPVEIAEASAEVAQVQASQASSGPRKLSAAGPNTNAQAVDVQAPVVAQGVISQNAVQGDVTGARVAELESGTSDRLLQGVGDRGSLAGVERDCETDPVCVAYLKDIEERVYARWLIPSELAGGRVKLRFRVDRGGSAHSIQVSDASDNRLGETCLQAFRHASPFPPPPREIHYIVNKSILANFYTSRVQTE